jgi:FAD-dependent urate hydroxylase
MLPKDVVVIGAGPFGLSISAHLRALEVDHLIVGRPLDTWREHMPKGMCLRSEPYGSDMSAPRSGFDVDAYCKLHGINDYISRLGPLALERFLEYGEWYIKNLVPEVPDYTVTSVDPVDGGFRVSFAEADSVLARRVVVATGVRPYAHLPAELRGLPPELVRHAIDEHELGEYSGRRVAVVGIGQSALETAALLHEQGAEVRMIGRGPSIYWIDANPAEINVFQAMQHPVNKLCEGWKCTFWNTPELYKFLPLGMKMVKTKTVLGPAGAWWLRPRVEGKIDVLFNHLVTSATPHGSGIRLEVAGPREHKQTLDVDHVIAATGFRVNLARLPFLPEETRARIQTVNGYPVVNRLAESAVPGLHFMGSNAAFSLGPSLRFIAGTHNISAKFAKFVRRSPQPAS